MSSAAAPNQNTPARSGGAPNAKSERRPDLIRSFIGHPLPFSCHSSFGEAPGAEVTGVEVSLQSRRSLPLLAQYATQNEGADDVSRNGAPDKFQFPALQTPH